MTGVQTAGQQRLTARVDGRVQGVGYRAFVQRQARRLALSGWVRNCADGSVEVLAEGSEGALQELERLLRRGPVGSAVSGVHFAWDEAAGDLAGFSIRY